MGLTIITSPLSATSALQHLKDISRENLRIECPGKESTEDSVLVLMGTIKKTNPSDTYWTLNISVQHPKFAGKKPLYDTVESVFSELSVSDINYASISDGKVLFQYTPDSIVVTEPGYFAKHNNMNTIIELVRVKELLIAAYKEKKAMLIVSPVK